MKTYHLFALAFLFTGCYGVNSETSEIGSIDALCLDSLAWKKICDEHSTSNIKNPEWLSRVDDVKEHFSKPSHVLYFKEEPAEIIGCDGYAVRAVYSPKLADQVLTGLSPLLGNDEQKRIRNRVLTEIMKYQCEKGRVKTSERMESEVPYHESHQKYPLPMKPEMQEADPG